MTWLKAQFEEEKTLSVLLERIVAEIRSLPSGSRARVHVYVDPVRRELYCDGAALAILNSLIVLAHLDEVTRVPEWAVLAVAPERHADTGSAPRDAIRGYESAVDEASLSIPLPIGLVIQPA